VTTDDVDGIKQWAVNTNEILINNIEKVTQNKMKYIISQEHTPDLTSKVTRFSLLRARHFV
jgi:hypothetical protein